MKVYHKYALDGLKQKDPRKGVFLYVFESTEQKLVQSFGYYNLSSEGFWYLIPLKLAGANLM